MIYIHTERVTLTVPHIYTERERVTLTENECNNMYQNNKTGTSLSVCIHIYTERERDDWHSLSLSMYIYTHSQREVLYIQSEREGARVDNL